MKSKRCIRGQLDEACCTLECRLGEPSQWNNLCLENKGYGYFRSGQCVDKYIILHEVFEAETATGSQVQASSVPPSIYNPRKQAGQSSGEVFSSPLANEMYNAGQETGFDENAPIAGKKRGSSSQGITSSGPSASRESKSSRSTSDPFVECANSLSTLANSKLHIRSRREFEKEKFGPDMAAQVVESFQGLDEGVKLAAVLAIQDDKWRKTFLSLSRKKQEYWLSSLQSAPHKGPDGK